MESYVAAKIQTELNAATSTRVFYQRVLIPWMKKTRRETTYDRYWYAEISGTPIESKDAPKEWPHWGNYAADYYLLSLEGACARGDAVNASRILEEVNCLEATLSARQRFNLHLFSGYYYVLLRRVHDAIREFSAAIEIQPDSFVAYGQRGNLHSAIGDYERASEDFSAVIRLSPSSPDGYFARAFVLHSRHDLDAALADYDAAIRLAPLNVHFLLYRAQLQIQRNDFDQARKDIDLAVRLEPTNPNPYRGRAKLFVMMEVRTNEVGQTALHDARTACELTGWKSPEYLRVLGDVYAALGEDALAKRWRAEADRIEGAAPSSPVENSE